MSITASLISFAVRQVTGLDASALVQWVEDRFTDHTQALPRALGRANDRAWQAVGLALGGESLFGWVGDLFRDGDMTAVREQIRRFLASTPAGLESTNATVRSRCLQEWTRLRKAGRLTLSTVPDRGQLAALSPSADVMQAATQAVVDAANALRGEAPHLADVLVLSPAGGVPLLASAFLFFFRREVETDAELSRGLTFDALQRLTQSQATGLAELERTLGGQTDRLFDALEGWFADVLARLDENRDLLHEVLKRNAVTGDVSGMAGVSVTSEREREVLRRVRDRLRALPAEVVEATDWMRLGDGQAAAGDFAGAGVSHAAAAVAAHEIEDKKGEAEGHFKAYRDGCEQGRWVEALAALRLAVTLDKGRFEPFPFKRYEPTALLGAGGFGAVFRCRDRYSGRDVAVKALHTAELTRELTEVFAEAHALRELNHPGIVRVIEQTFADIENERRPYFVLEYFDGPTLEAWRRERGGVLSPEELLPVARGIAEAVHAAHCAKILHRDLKPANVLARMAGGAWEVRVIDFGLAVRHSAAVRATVAGAASSERTRREASFAGTLRYAAPEQKGELMGVQVGPYSDVYAFGKTCQELLFGHTQPGSEDWDDLGEPWGGRWRRLLEACVRIAVAGKRPRVADFGAVLAEMEGWGKVAVMSAGPDPAEVDDKARRQEEITQNAERWAATSAPAEWVRARNGQWDHAEWVALVDVLKSSKFWPMRREDIERVVEAERARWQAEATARSAEKRQRDERETAELERVRWQAEERERLAAEKLAKPGQILTLGWQGNGWWWGSDNFEMHFAWIPPGTFLMGSDTGNENEKPVHRVTITKGFYLGVFLVTQAQWYSILGENPSAFKGRNRPVERVSWRECQNFCFQFRNVTGRVLRLPTEAEWEYACRAGTTTDFSFGSTLNGTQANCSGLSPHGTSTHGPYRRQTSDVGSYPANPWGLFDTHGNVCEWCQDWYGPYTSLAVTDPVVSEKLENSPLHVLRGGRWHSSGIDCRSSSRDSSTPILASDDIGFRVCLTLD